MPIAISNYLRKRIWARLEKCVSSIRPTKDTTGAFERKRKREARGAFSERDGERARSPLVSGTQLSQVRARSPLVSGTQLHFYVRARASFFIHILEVRSVLKAEPL